MSLLGFFAINRKVWVERKCVKSFMWDFLTGKFGREFSAFFFIETTFFEKE